MHHLSHSLKPAHPTHPAPHEQAETVERAFLPHVVDSGNFYHLISEIAPTFFANWCKFVGVCQHARRHGFDVSPGRGAGCGRAVP